MSINLKPYLKTEKQKEFNTNFFENAENYEVWEEVVIGEQKEGCRKFIVKKEDIISYSQGVLDDNPVFNDEEEAKNSSFGQLIPHPLFLVQIGFYCTEEGITSWIRSPGARNPGQQIEIFEPFYVGEEITLRITHHDKWIRRGKHYLTDKLEYINQDGKPKAIWYASLILPKDREELLSYCK